MINLIPSKAKRCVIVEYWVRVLSVWLVIWSISLVSAASIIFPSYVLLGAQVEAYKLTPVSEVEKEGGFSGVEQSLKDSSRQAKSLIDTLSGALLSEYIVAFEGLETDGIHLNEISISRDSEAIKPINISGVAKDRQSLASFRDRLLSEKMVESVDFPISNLAQDKDISFSMTVVLTKDDV